MLDEPRYQQLADQALRRIERALTDVDSDEADCELAGDVMTITLRGGARCVLNTQRSTRQIWLAANAHAWHFSYDEPGDSWKDDKGQGVDLFEQVARVLREGAGVVVRV